MVNALALVVTVGALGAVGVRTAQHLTRPPDPNAVREIKEWATYADAGHRMGVSRPAVTIVEFADFQCPFCARAVADLEEILEEHGEDVALVFRHFPLTTHLHARQAALAAECAAEQDRFREFYFLLFARQREIGERTWADFANDAGVSDVAAFQLCLGDGRYEAVIERDSAAAAELRIQGTPTFLINDMLVPGYLGRDSLAATVRASLQAATR